MNSMALQEARPQVDLDTRLLQFRQTIAQRCANILYGCYTGKRKLCIEIPGILTGVSFISMRNQEFLKEEISVSFLKLLGDGYTISSTTVSVILRDNHTCTRKEKYLRIQAKVSKL
jgi:hypothetical protein